MRPRGPAQGGQVDGRPPGFIDGPRVGAPGQQLVQGVDGAAVGGVVGGGPAVLVDGKRESIWLG